MWCIHREFSYESIGERILKIVHIYYQTSSGILFETQCISENTKHKRIVDGHYLFRVHLYRPILFVLFVSRAVDALCYLQYVELVHGRYTTRRTVSLV